MQIGNLDSDRLVGRNIAYLQVEDISALLVKIPICGLSTFFYGCLILQPCFFLFFDHFLDSCCPKLCDKFVDTGTGIDGEAIFHFQKHISGVVVDLGEVDIDNGVDYFNVVVCYFEGNECELIKSIVMQFWVEGIATAFFKAAVGDGLCDKIIIFLHVFDIKSK